MHYAAFARSTSESVVQLREEADACMADFVHVLKSAGDDSKNFFDGDVLAKAETSKTDLESLLKNIDDQTDVLLKKEAAISSKSLPDAEKKELLAILAEQKKPLQDLKGRIEIFQQRLVQFTQADASRWKETFQLFESISGTERAQEKLKAEITTFLKAIPFLKELEKSSSSAWKKKASTAQVTPMPSPSPRTEGENYAHEAVKQIVPKNSPTPMPLQQDSIDHDDRSLEWSILIALIVPPIWLFLLAKAGKKSKGLGSIGNTFCALNSFLFPGLGQFAQRRWGAGILFMLGSLLWIVYLGWIIHIWSCINAARWHKSTQTSG